MEPENSNQKLVTKYPAVKEPNEGCNKNNKKSNNRLEVEGNSIIVMEEMIVIVTWDMNLK